MYLLLIAAILGGLALFGAGVYVFLIDDIKSMGWDALLFIPLAILIYIWHNRRNRNQEKNA